MNNLGVIVNTCDAYEFVWKGWWYYFRKYWDWNLNAEVFFMTENKKPYFNGITTYCTGKCEHWSDRIKKLLEYISYEYIIYI